MEQLFFAKWQWHSRMKVVSHNDLPIQKGIWDVDKVDLRENLDHVRLIFIDHVKFHIVARFLKSFVTNSMIFFWKVIKIWKKQFKIMSMVQIGSQKCIWMFNFLLFHILSIAKYSYLWKIAILATSKKLKTKHWLHYEQ